MYELDSTDLQFLPGMGPKRAAMLNTEVDIHTFRDLLYYFPYKYIDRSKIYTISEITSAVPYIQLKGKIISYKLIGEGRAQRLSARFIDSTGEIELIWFQKIKFIPD
ncbi:MAG: ATP-dependent DNA helicase RecG, partial [Paludibacteraceae bacterium]|nr:ATP-dependent DNA helicase RecG [Paludibacteraceae bacterium]